MRRRMSWLFVIAACLALTTIWLAGSASSAIDAPAKSTHAVAFEFKVDDHLCILGNTLADRMQHFGWLETRLHLGLPKHQLVVRHLGFSGDEIQTRLRSADFGSPEEWLRRCQATVIFAFFGYNESFAGLEGLADFKTQLKRWITNTQQQKYDGKNTPRLVLFSPIAHEDLHNPLLPDGKANNERLELYTQAMAEVAAQSNIPFIDLFHPTLSLYAQSKSPLTINGIHLNEAGDHALAQIIERSLLSKPVELNFSNEFTEKVRQAVLEKNHYWFNRYRTVDGYSIYGGRADLRFVKGQTNREVMQREMEVLDVMTSNRDRAIWSLLQKQPYSIKDDNLPPFIPVITNKPGPLPDGKHLFLSGPASIEKMTVSPPLKVNLFASEEMFPELVNPVQMAWDSKGRLWVAVWPTYPHWKPTEPMNDKILILEDTNGDGQADKCTTFADHLHNPTGFEFVPGGVLVAQAPDLLLLKDPSGTGKATVRERLVHGIDSADTHHTSNSFVLDPMGSVYFQEGTFHHTQVESPYGPPRRCVNAGVFRYDPRKMKFDIYITFGFANPHGHVFDRWGQDIVIDGTGSNPYHAALFSGYLPYPQKHKQPPQIYQPRTRPCPGIEILSSQHFPPDMQGDLLVANVIGMQGILRYKLIDDGGSFKGLEAQPLLSSSDPNFRPSDLKMGPDGALYFLDWHNPIIGHMQHNLRDPSRDREHGRIYRVTYQGRPLSKPASIAGQPIPALLDLLKHSEDRVRYRTRLELAGRDTDQVMAGIQNWLAQLDRNDPQYEHHLLEALWVQQNHHQLQTDLLKRVLQSPDFRARAAAVRILSFQVDELPESLALVMQAATDAHPRVRLEAVRAASFFTRPEAIEIVLLARTMPSDPYVAFVDQESLRVLAPLFHQAIATNKPVLFSTDIGKQYLLQNLSVARLLSMERTRSVCHELLFRPGVLEADRRNILKTLARFDNADELAVLLAAIRAIDNGKEQRDETVLLDLLRLWQGRSPEELKAIRPELEALTLNAHKPATRQIGYLTLITVDQSAEKAWQLACRSVPHLQDFLNAVPMISDLNLRTALYPRISQLLEELPDPLQKMKDRPTLMGRFVRIELPGPRRILTLAEVEVYCRGVNIARHGKASQINTAFGGAPERAIDGNRSGVYGQGGQTHTQENIANPWWEVDLGADEPIESIVVYNRTEGNFAQRLNPFTIKILNDRREVIWEKNNLPAPKASATYPVQAVPALHLVRHAAMSALVSVRGKEQETFRLLQKFIANPLDQAAAVQSLQRLPQTTWPGDEAPKLLNELLAAIRKLPESSRTSDAALSLIELAESLTTLLPADQATQKRAELRAMSVRILRIGTLPERMTYDKEVLVIEAGKPVEFIFENHDFMPHNLVIVQPGSLEKVGMTAEATAQDPSASSRHYVPLLPEILLSSKLLQSGEKEKLPFVAPSKPGVYPYVCTYPGHWRRMFGALYVVQDLDAYLRNAESYLAKHPVTILDELLKDRRPRTEWRLEDLILSVNRMEHGQSFNHGKQLFQVAGCIACHRMEGIGQEFGPDLLKLDPKWEPGDILKHIIDPSAKIDEKYQVHILQLSSGKQLTGMILEETNDSIKLIENPQVKAEPIIIKKADIEARKLSPHSLMPKGLLDTLNRDEILDLIAYLASRGNTKHPLFQAEIGKGHQHNR